MNDQFSKLPVPLLEIINNPEKRKKLVVYINPPYAEASNKKTFEKGKEGNRGVEQSSTNKKYAKILGQGNAELFAQFLTRIYFEIDGCLIAEFSKLKILNGQHFIDFRNFFKAKLEKCFVVPANTFDNVDGQFPIGFMIWDTGKKETFEKVISDVFNQNGELVQEKIFTSYINSHYINDWIKPFRAEKNDKYVIGKFPFKGNDFQNQNMIAVVHQNMDYNKEAGQFLINSTNLIQASIYYAVRKCIAATWLNDRDQFLYPNSNWKTNIEFQNDCLTFTLFRNNIQSKFGINNWIPFTEQEVNSREKFQSNFMSKFISGKLKPEANEDLFGLTTERITPLVFSPEAQIVFDAGREFWKYYHVQTDINVNASLYDIREYFQGRNTQGKMKNKGVDPNYNALITNLRSALKLLANKISLKVYEYGFLKG